MQGNLLVREAVSNGEKLLSRESVFRDVSRAAADQVVRHAARR